MKLEQVTLITGTVNKDVYPDKPWPRGLGLVKVRCWGKTKLIKWRKKTELWLRQKHFFLLWNPFFKENINQKSWLANLACDWMDGWFKGESDFLSLWLKKMCIIIYAGALTVSPLLNSKRFHKKMERSEPSKSLTLWWICCFCRTKYQRFNKRFNCFKPHLTAPGFISQSGLWIIFMVYT